MKTLSPNIIIELMKRLPVDEFNINMYEAVLSLPYQLYHPIMIRILTGEVSIYDFVPYSGDLINDHQDSKVAELKEKYSLKEMILRKFQGKELPYVIVNDDYTTELVKKQKLIALQETLPDSDIENAHIEQIFAEAKKHIVTTIYENIVITDLELAQGIENGKTLNQLKKEKQLKYFDILRNGI